MNRYLLEVGVEEFPAKYIKSTQAQMRMGIDKFLKENKYKCSDIKINSTPRRFSILIEGLEPENSSLTEKVKGPAKKIAFKEDQPTKALEGFLRSKKLTFDDITFEEINGEEYVFANIVSQVKSIDQVLQENMPLMIKSISNPKAMRWGGKNLRFLRPIRWILSILDDKVLEFDLEGISVSNVTKGHRTLGSSHIEINSIDEYEQKLKENYVIVSEDERRRIIIRGLNILSKEKGGNFLSDDELLEEVVNINEYPTPFIGTFDNNYLALPKEVIITPMKDHQRYFPIENDNAALLPYFISVRNGNEKGMENVIAGNEKVLVARLEDAKFFYNHDISKKLEDYVVELSNLGFHDGLGSMMEKTNRLVKLVPIVAKALNIYGDTVEIAKRAAYLSKADLVTKSVIEFTELQGVMGRIYAKNSGENNLVCQAIEEQYMPTHSGAQLPTTIGGVILSLSEKLDNICGLHSLGIEVTGSQDPYGQRRAVLGILNILISNKMSLDLSKLIKDTLYVYVESFGETFNYEQVSKSVEKFVKSRLRNKMIDEGFRYDIVDSVLNSEEFDVYVMYEKIRALMELFAREDIEKSITQLVRITNISKNAAGFEIDEALLSEGDRSIYDLNPQLEKVDSYVAVNSFVQSMEEIFKIAEVVDKYLDNTMINVEDEKVKENRLALIKNISKRIESVFDVSLIVRG